MFPCTKLALNVLYHPQFHRQYCFLLYPQFLLRFGQINMYHFHMGNSIGYWRPFYALTEIINHDINFINDIFTTGWIHSKSLWFHPPNIFCSVKSIFLLSFTENFVVQAEIVKFITSKTIIFLDWFHVPLHRLLISYDKSCLDNTLCKLWLSEHHKVESQNTPKINI